MAPNSQGYKKILGSKKPLFQWLLTCLKFFTASISYSGSSHYFSWAWLLFLNNCSKSTLWLPSFRVDVIDVSRWRRTRFLFFSAASPFTKNIFHFRPCLGWNFWAPKRNVLGCVKSNQEQVPPDEETASKQRTNNDWAKDMSGVSEPRNKCCDLGNANATPRT